jgi:hypothetical protein
MTNPIMLLKLKVSKLIKLLVSEYLRVYFWYLFSKERASIQKASKILLYSIFVIQGTKLSCKILENFLSLKMGFLDRYKYLKKIVIICAFIPVEKSHF